MGAVKKPKPFQRPSIDLTPASGAKKEWREVTPDLLAAGDIIMGEGLIVAVNLRRSDLDLVSGNTTVHYKFAMKNGKTLRYVGTDTVKAFTEGVSPWRR